MGDQSRDSTIRRCSHIPSWKPWQLSTSASRASKPEPKAEKSRSKAAGIASSQDCPASRSGLRCRGSALGEAIASTLPPPDPVYVLDLGRTDAGLRLVELNPLSRADPYGCDPNAIVAAVAARLDQSRSRWTSIHHVWSSSTASPGSPTEALNLMSAFSVASVPMPSGRPVLPDTRPSGP